MDYEMAMRHCSTVLEYYDLAVECLPQAYVFGQWILSNWCCFCKL